MRHTARRIEAGGVANSHEPWNCLARSGHGLHGEGCAGRVYTGFRRPVRDWMQYRPGLIDGFLATTGLVVSAEYYRA